MRILIFTNDFPPDVGGVQTVAYELARHLSLAGASVSVLARHTAGASEFDREQAFAVTRFSAEFDAPAVTKPFQRAGFARALLRVMASAQPDCVLCLQWDPCGYLAALLQAAGLLRRPYYVMTHGMDILRIPARGLQRQAKAALRALAFRRARRVFAVSHYIRDRLADQGIAPERVTVIANGVDWAGSPVLAAEMRGHTLLTVARLVRRKGQDQVLRALPQVLQQAPDVTYHIAGDGPERARLEQLACELGVSDRVVFHGTVLGAPKDRLYQSCTVFVMTCRETPTDFEGFGIVYLEAMQYAKPVVAGRTGGVADIVEDGVTGSLVDPDDVAGLAAALSRLLRDPDEARRLGENGRRMVAERFRWESLARQYLAVLRE